MIKVGFICVHNSCRSQMAEALGKLLASDCFESYSAGTEVVDRINSDGVKIMKKLYGVDMDKNQYSKTLDDIPKLDIVIKMGCNVVCPIVPNVYMEDWGIEDPTGKGEEEFLKTAKLIEEKVISLKNRINTLKI
ncbi:MAG: arsenate reductase ArsC [Clostridium sp.]